MTMTDHLTRTWPMLIVTKHSRRTRGWRTTDWYRSVGLAALLTYRGAHTLEHTSKQHRTERERATRRRGLGFQTAASALETSLSRREEIGSSSLHLLHTLPSSLAFLLSWWERGLFLLLSLFLSPSISFSSFVLSFFSLLFLSLFLSWCEQLSTYLYQENFWPPRASRGYCFPRPGALGIPRLPFSSSVSWYSRQSAFLSLPLCSSSRSRDIVSFSARFDSQEHCIYRCIREKSCTKFQRICFYCMWFRIHEHVNQLYKLMREYVCYSIASLIIRNHESEEI